MVLLYKYITMHGTTNVKFEILCIWLVLLYKYITMHGTTNVKKKALVSCVVFASA
jgi:hypothetical protein